MKDSYTHITLILDRSGSMDSIRNDVVGGLNRFIADQKAVPGECTLTLVQFDSQNAYEILRDHQPIATVQPIGDEYMPRASTPLYDAIGRGIVNTGEKLKALPESDRPAKVIFAVMTDGYENASREYDRQKIRQMTETQTNVYKWQFVYLGANQDAMAEGQKIGVASGSSATWVPTAGGINLATKQLSANASSYRSGTTMDCAFTDEQRTAQKQEAAKS